MKAKFMLICVLVLVSAPSWTQHKETSVVTYSLSWGPFVLATIDDQITVTDQAYAIESVLTVADWISVFGVPSLQRSVTGEISPEKILHPHAYSQQFALRRSSIEFDYINGQISWQDSKRGAGQEPLLSGKSINPVDTLSSQYLFHASEKLPERFIIQFVNSRRVREYEFQFEHDAVVITTPSGSYSAVQYKCLTQPLIFWYAPVLGWIPVKAQYGEGITALQIELIDITVKT